MSVDWDGLVIGPLLGIYGEPFTWNLSGLSAFTANAVFDEAYSEVDLAGGTAVMSSVPAAGIRLADFPRAPAKGDRCTCQRTGENFVVQRPKPDSHGHVLLILNGVGA